MNLNTIWSLNYGDEGEVIEEGDNIKVYLENGEILIGDYSNSDWCSLTIDRESGELEIDFKDVKDIEVLRKY